MSEGKRDFEEKGRLEQLMLYRIMDTAAEQAFDNLTQLAATICDTPIALVSLVDDKRQWFKARVGLTARETSRRDAFCAHALHDEGLLIVDNAREDARFRDNPLVTGEPHIRFYAGAPLKVETGAILGTLCVIDHQPRTLSDRQRHGLSILRDAVVAQLELRRARDEMERLQPLMPLCAWCRSVRVSDGEKGVDHWVPLHEFVASSTPVTHGICPNCSERELG